jgi:hypothetical protein
MKNFIVGAIVAFIFATSAMLFATDTSHRLDEYLREGYSADYVVDRVLDNSNTHAALSIKYRSVTIGLKELFGMSVESLYYPVICIPKGYTYYLHSARLAAFTEANGATTQVSYLAGIWQDSSGATLDTFVSTMSIDADSIDYSKVAYPLTLNDTTFAGGDILWLKLKHTLAAGTVGLIGGGVTFDFSAKRN